MKKKFTDQRSEATHYVLQNKILHPGDGYSYPLEVTNIQLLSSRPYGFYSKWGGRTYLETVIAYSLSFCNNFLKFSGMKKSVLCKKCNWLNTKRFCYFGKIGNADCCLCPFNFSDISIK